MHAVSNRESKGEHKRDLIVFVSKHPLEKTPNLILNSWSILIVAFSDRGALRLLTTRSYN